MFIMGCVVGKFGTKGPDCVTGMTGLSIPSIIGICFVISPLSYNT